jgi:Uma2 family endonuclease
MPVSSSARTRRRRDHPENGDLTWDIARLFPAQGEWTESQYLRLESLYGEDIRVELYDGCLEILAVPTMTHQLIIRFLLRALEEFVAAQGLGGLVLFMGTRVKLSTKGGKAQYREPDIVYMKESHLDRCLEEYWEGADLVMEVVSGDPKDRERDLVEKLREYAAARIPEYWIVHPEERFIRVLTLRGRAYKLHGEFRPGMDATCVLLPGFSVSVGAVLAAGTSKRKRK